MAASNVSQKGLFLSKKRHHKFHHPLFESVFNCFHRTRAMYNFHKKGEGSESRMLFLFRLEGVSIKLKEIRDKVHAAVSINSIFLSHIRKALNQIR